MAIFVNYAIVTFTLWSVIGQVLLCMGQTTVPGSTNQNTTSFLLDEHLVNKYTVTNGTGTVCIVMAAEIVFHIKYNASDSVQTANVTIPDTYNVSGDCISTDNQQQLNINFFNNTWSLKIIIKKDAKDNTERLGKGLVSSYYWSEIDTKYTVTEELFPSVSPHLIGEQVTTATFFVSGIFHTNGESYRCNRTTNVTQVETTIQMSHFQYRAFGTTNDTDFSDADVTECIDSHETPVKKVDETAAIAIGGICACLLVVVFIVYVLFRWKDHKKYQML